MKKEEVVLKVLMSLYDSSFNYHIEWLFRAKEQRVYTKETPLVLRMSLTDGEATCYYKGAQEVSKRVYDKTGGKIKINVIPGSALGDERGTVELAMNGDLDIATSANSVLTNWIPQMAILDQAYLWKNSNEAHAAVDGAVGKLIEQEAQKKWASMLSAIWNLGSEMSFL